MQGGHSLEPTDSTPPEFWSTSGDWILDSGDLLWILHLTASPLKLVEPLALNDTDLPHPYREMGYPLERADGRVLVS